MNEDLKVLTGAVAAIQSAAGEIADFVELAKVEGAEVSNNASSPFSVVVRWPNGYEVHIFVKLPDARLRIATALFRYGQSINRRECESLESAWARCHR